jgi:hypothetical protein
VGVWIWWLSEVITFNIPWNKLLVSIHVLSSKLNILQGEGYDTKEPFEFYVYVTEAAKEQYNARKSSVLHLREIFN